MDYHSGSVRCSVSFEQRVLRASPPRDDPARLPVGEARIDVALLRAGSGAAVHVHAHENDIRVMTTSSYDVASDLSVLWSARRSSQPGWFDPCSLRLSERLSNLYTFEPILTH
jgi:hypothetical protein